MRWKWIFLFPVLRWHRFWMDRCDDGIYRLVCWRTRLARGTRRYKTKIVCVEREKYIIERLGKKRCLKREQVECLWQLLILWGRQAQAQELEQEEAKPDLWQILQNVQPLDIV